MHNEPVFTAGAKKGVLERTRLSRRCRRTRLCRRTLEAFVVVLALALSLALSLNAQSWKPAISANPLPHFETVGGKKVFFADGLPFTVLTVETQWEGLIYGRYAETMRVYDYMYPAARAMGLNALKVPVKWSMVEPSRGVYDFSYVDHVKNMAEANDLKLVLGWFGHYASGEGTIYSDKQGNVFAPMYIIEDTKSFPRAVDADGIPHHDAVSYEYPEIVQREVAAFRAFMDHLRKTDAKRTVLMIQVENEIDVFGAGPGGKDRRDQRRWRDHSEISNRRFRERGFTSDLAYSAWALAVNWLRPLTEAGSQIYPLPMFMNFVGGTLAEGIVGGSAGEDVATYLEHIPAAAFIGVNHYPTWGDNTPAPVSVPASAARSILDRYRIGRNIPTFTETNSDNGPLAPRLAFLSVAEYGSPLFAPWALSDSCPTPGEPYVTKDGTLANGAFALGEAYTALRKGGPAVAQFGGTSHAAVFLAEMPGYRFRQTKEFDDIAITVAGVNNGQAIALRTGDRELLILGFRCSVDVKAPTGDRAVRVERGAWVRDEWHSDGPVDGGAQGGEIRFRLAEPQAVRISW